MPADNIAPPAITGPAAGRRLAAIACLLVVGSFLGLSLVVTKLAVERGAAPLALLCLTMIISGAALAIGERRSGNLSKINRRIAEYAIVAGVLFALPNAVAFLAVRHVGAGFLSLVFAFPVLLTYLISLTLRLEPFSRTKALGVCAGLTGGCILGLSKMSAGSSPAFWVLLSMMLPVAVALGNIYRSLRWPPGVSPMFLASGMMLCGGFAALPFALWRAPGGFLDLINVPDLALLLAAQTGIFTILYYFYFLLQRLAGPVYLSQTGSIGAIVGTSVAVVALHEAVPANLAVATLFVVIGMVLFQIGSKQVTRKRA